ncbi:lipopolysaccharide heptosyltransferase I [Zooshikella harenae]|uniref:Lipopolysaccharide heptosyltransferase 1 n=1 Tax=Zooshikella harenae TaxID=2827238 RepID=A0ABS5ZBJ6_9GAMM|nr:lipopolysaccharide heptosyltransferase I [Zooshikella harenae]MBU2710686.1 lipopolysaccharide heptosyltransferase I [Zooshikella harenae]
MKKVLVVKTSSLGDVIHTLPALTDAQEAIPGIRFDWVVEEAFAEIPHWHPAVDKVIPVAIRRWRKNILKTMKQGEWQQFKQQLQATKYDAVIDAQGLLKSAWLTYLTHGQSYGMDKSSVREALAAHFYQHTIPVVKGIHAVERVRQLFANALDYKLPSQRGQFALDKAMLNADSTKTNQLASVLPSNPYVVFLHGTTREQKHWPEPYWFELAEKLAVQGLYIVLPWGNAVERQRANLIQSKVSSKAVVLPKLNLAGIASVLAKATCVIAVDTGLGHLAAALDRPCISLYGPTSPRLVGTYGEGQCHLTVDNANATNNKPLPAVEPAIFRSLMPTQVFQAVQPFLA